ncbi:DNA-binding MarR family transcriptional regulator [Agromyces terreus]|uniref:DNA-binding MarR family transcriptional regulator n=1 Tax=Agromyces terreus TaxID=424795 RepID=A0A9X2KC18_9MICO|nr:MarR family transcriptional regulator [Agromyces terreus]MCP2371199.1 DNA-binding MarR family transcriptional regulator [Agromyces terreus]
MGAVDRAARVASVLESMTLLSRAVTAGRRTPFGDHELSRTQLQALFTLAHRRGPVTPSILASTLGVTPGAVTQLIDGLKAAGLVETDANPDDARSRILRMTDAAATEVDRFERSVIERMRPRFDLLDDGELILLADLLDRITEET